jgi:hypothetical protein
MQTEFGWKPDWHWASLVQPVQERFLKSEQLFTPLIEVAQAHLSPH